MGENSLTSWLAPSLYRLVLLLFQRKQPWVLVTFEPSANLCAFNAFSFIFILIWFELEICNWCRNGNESLERGSLVQDNMKSHLQLKNYFREQIKLQIVAFRKLRWSSKHSVSRRPRRQAWNSLKFNREYHSSEMDETRTGTFKSSCQSQGEEIVALFLRLSRNDFLTDSRAVKRLKIVHEMAVT